MCTRTLECKSKEANWFKGVFIPQLKIIVRVFLPLKLKKSPSLDYHRTVECGKHRTAKI